MSKVRLDILVQDHLPHLLKWRNNELIWKWCRQNDLIDIHHHLAWFEKQANDKTIRMYSIKNDIDAIVGVCGLTSIDLINQRAEFSLYIGPEWQRGGYATEALTELLEIGFTRYPLNSIFGETFDWNPATKLFEKLGMKKDGTLRKSYFRQGTFIDSHIYSILRSEWIAKNQ